LRCHRTNAAPALQFTHRTPFEHAGPARTLTPTPSLPPSLSRGLLACVSRHARAHVLLCRSLARASSRSTWCVRLVGVLVQYVWRAHGTRVSCHVRRLTNRTCALVGVQPFGGCGVLPKRTRGAILAATVPSAGAAWGYSRAHGHKGALAAYAILVRSDAVVKSDAAATAARACALSRTRVASIGYGGATYGAGMRLDDGGLCRASASPPRILCIWE
jgi:hypothetical protein